MLRVGDFAKIDITKMRKTMKFGGMQTQNGTSVVSSDENQEDIFGRIRKT